MTRTEPLVLMTRRSVPRLQIPQETLHVCDASPRLHINGGDLRDSLTPQLNGSRVSFRCRQRVYPDHPPMGGHLECVERHLT